MTLHTGQTELPWHLKGNWEPVFEEVTETELEVTGEIPRELNGRYMRAGMNPRSGYSDHWFFGNGMIHSVELREGRAVSYRNRYVRTPYYEKDMGMMDGFASLEYSPANTSVLRHANRILCLEEAHFPWQIAPDLETVGCVDFGGRLNTPMTAHPRICPQTDEMLFFGYQIMNTDTFVTYHRVDAAGSLVQSEPIEIPRPVMMHDWNVTRHHVIFMDLPLCFELESGGFHWAPEHGARLGVMPRTGTNADVVWYEIDPCFVFHPMNAYEDGDRIVIDVARLPRAMAGGMHDVGQDGQEMWRWTIDRAAGNVHEEKWEDRPSDFCRVDDRRVGLPARWGYAMALMPGTGGAPGIEYGEELYKYDLEHRTTEVHALGKAVKGGEPVFAPRSADAEEDDGWVMALCHDENVGRSKLVILDARDFSAEPVAQVHLPVRVPYGAHGNWMPGI